MSFGSNGYVDISLPSTNDLSNETNSQYRAGSVDANGNFILATGAGQTCIGVLQNNPGVGQAATIRCAGVTKFAAGAAIAAGALLKVGADGRCLTAVLASVTQATVPNNVTGSDVIGIALAAATAAGDIIGVLLQPRGAVPGTAA